jgi:hypothetical protein
MVKMDKHIVLTIKRKPNWFILFLTGLWTLGWTAILGTVIYGLSTDSDKIDAQLAIFMTLFFIAGLFVIKIFLWHVRGHEKITLDKNELKIEKLGTILTIPKTFETRELDSFSLTEKPTTAKWIKFWGLGGGQVQFNYMGQYKYFGQSLTKKDAKELIDNLNDRLKTTTR